MKRMPIISTHIQMGPYINTLIINTDNGAREIQTRKFVHMRLSWLTDNYRYILNLYVYDIKIYNRTTELSVIQGYHQ